MVNSLLVLKHFFFSKCMFDHQGLPRVQLQNILRGCLGQPVKDALESFHVDQMEHFS